MAAFPTINILSLIKTVVKKTIALSFSAIGAFSILTVSFGAFGYALYNFYSEFGFSGLLLKLQITGLDLSFVDAPLLSLVLYACAFDKFVFIWNECIDWIGLSFDLFSLGLVFGVTPSLVLYCWRWMRLIGMEAAGVFDE